MAKQRPVAVIKALSEQQGREEAERGKGDAQGSVKKIVPFKGENPDVSHQDERGINQQNGTAQRKKIQP
ncbi:hypothetical protein [Enterobacter hormaechei]|uniref:hypothetical protein n=1 Tax=Enterobacter hormaechei TaxID=158836 RepID=UPI00111326EF|nr:hypothetical protein [Enterobacter hormaechei]